MDYKTLMQKLEEAKKRMEASQQKSKELKEKFEELNKKSKVLKEEIKETKKETEERLNNIPHIEDEKIIIDFKPQKKDERVVMMGEVKEIVPQQGEKKEIIPQQTEVKEIAPQQVESKFSIKESKKAEFNQEDKQVKMFEPKKNGKKPVNRAYMVVENIDEEINKEQEIKEIEVDF